LGSYTAFPIYPERSNYEIYTLSAIYNLTRLENRSRPNVVFGFSEYFRAKVPGAKITLADKLALSRPQKAMKLAIDAYSSQKNHFIAMIEGLESQLDYERIRARSLENKLKENESKRGRKLDNVVVSNMKRTNSQFATEVI
jgi:hypothetical protein